MLVPGMGIRGTTPALDGFFPVVRGRTAWLAAAVFPLLVRLCHHSLGDNPQCPGMTQELLRDPVSHGAVAAWLLVLASQSPS